MQVDVFREDTEPGTSLRLPELPPFLRVLLVTDGTVTRSLEAYFWEPIEVDVLNHADTISDTRYPEIEVAPGEPMVKRQVILRGKATRSVYVFAESIFATNRVPPAVRDHLVEERKGIGEVLREGRLETYRELYDLRRAEAGKWAMVLGIEASTSVLVRKYKIYIGARAAIQIEEVFATSRF